MIDAIVRDGTIVPLVPLPSDWQDGTALHVEKSESVPKDIDRWATDLNELCASSSDVDEEAMLTALEQHRKVAKAQMSHEMGLQE